MSLETLLEAAKYLEYRSEAKARGEEPQDYYTFAKLGVDVDPLRTNKSGGSKSSSVKPDHTESYSPTSYGDDREKRRYGGAGTREVHNKLEKNRRAHLKECFEVLKKQLPSLDDRKTSNLSILRGALRCIQSLKRKEREYEHEMERLAREKIAAQQRLAFLKKEISTQLDHVDISYLLPDPDNETTTTASECGPLSDLEDDGSQQQISISTNHVLSATDSTNSCTSPPLSVASSTASQGPLPMVSSKAPSNAIGLNHSLAASVPALSLNSLATIENASSKPQLMLVASTAAVSSAVKTLSSLAAAISPGTQQSPLPLSNKVLTTTGVHMPGMSGVVASQSAVQLLTQPNSVKVITPPASVATSPSVSTASVGHSTNGSLHIIAPSTSPLVAVATAPPTSVTVVTSIAKPLATRSLVRVAPALAAAAKQSLMGPVALVAPQTVVGVTQVGTGTKPIIINQAASLTGVAVSPAAASPTLTVAPLTMKTGTVAPSATVVTTATTVSARTLHTNTAGTVSQGSILATLDTGKALPQILQQTRTITAQQVLSPAASTSQVTTVGRQTVTASIKPMAQVRSALPQIPSMAHVTHVMSPASVGASIGQIMSAGNHISTVTPLVTPMSMVSHPAAVNQVLAQPQAIGKVLATPPILKSMGQIPIIQQPFLQPAMGTIAGQQMVKPVVMVSMPSVATATGGQQGTVSIPASQ